jgi:SAM-dependent methyltransferase
MNTHIKSDDQVDWTQFHSREASWRTRLLGDLSAQYAIPRYVRLFLDTFSEFEHGRFLELGAGNGEVPLQIQQLNPPCVGRYLVTELFREGTRWLAQQGLSACAADAQRIPFADDAFDAVISFDVLHHVSDPYRMAREMVRASRGRLLLVESNGLSLGRKLMELTPGHRRAGERSYTPRQYRSFFAAAARRLTRFEIHPFLFPFPGGVPPALLGALIYFNEKIEKAPFFRWQCSNVFMQIEFEK